MKENRRQAVIGMNSAATQSPFSVSIDVASVHDRLNAIVATLQQVGIDPAALTNKQMTNNRNGSELGAVKKSGSADDQINIVLQKLQELQAEAPLIVAALEATAESHSVSSKKSKESQEHPKSATSAPAHAEDDDDDDDDDDEDGEENWPTVGPGISDDISVMSDLTIPTVCPDHYVSEEENYAEVKYPVVVGGGPGAGPPMVLKPPKRRSLLNPIKAGQPPQISMRRMIGAPQAPVQPTTLPHSSSSGGLSTGAGGGAAAKRRNLYIQRMAKLGVDEVPNKPLPAAPAKMTRKKFMDHRGSFTELALRAVRRQDGEELSQNDSNSGSFFPPSEATDQAKAPLIKPPATTNASKGPIKSIKPLSPPKEKAVSEGHMSMKSNDDDNAFNAFDTSNNPFAVAADRTNQQPSPAPPKRKTAKGLLAPPKSPSARRHAKTPTKESST